MLWQIQDNGKMIVRLRSTGQSAAMLDNDKVNAYIANIIGDLQVTQGVEVVTDELRASFSTTSPEVNVTWRARVPEVAVETVRAYMVRMSEEAPGE